MSTAQHSTRYLIQVKAFELLEAIAPGANAQAAYNPALPVQVPEVGPTRGRLLFMLDRGDTLIDQPSNREKRQTRFVIGALVRTPTRDADADTLHWLARLAMRQNLRATLKEAGINAPIVREAEVEPGLFEMQAEGALLMSGFQVEYIEDYPL